MAILYHCTKSQLWSSNYIKCYFGAPLNSIPKSKQDSSFIRNNTFLCNNQSWMEKPLYASNKYSKQSQKFAQNFAVQLILISIRGVVHIVNFLNTAKWQPIFLIQYFLHYYCYFTFRVVVMQWNQLQFQLEKMESILPSVSAAVSINTILSVALLFGPSFNKDGENTN